MKKKTQSSCLFVLIYFSLLPSNLFGLEKCSLKLVPEQMKVAFNYYTELSKKEQKGFFNTVDVIGSKFGQSGREIAQGLDFFIPLRGINTFNTKRDRLIYNFLIDQNKDKQEVIHVKIHQLKNKTALLKIKLNEVEKVIPFEFDSRDVSMQAIGHIDLEDFNLNGLKEIIETQFQVKIWNDLFFDIRAKLNKTCEKEL